MQTRFRFIHFAKAGVMAGHEFYDCRNNRSGCRLGVVEWYAPWRQYIFSPLPDTVFSQSCLDDIRVFMTSLTAKPESEAQGCLI